MIWKSYFIVQIQFSFLWSGYLPENFVPKIPECLLFFQPYQTTGKNLISWYSVVEPPHLLASLLAQQNNDSRWGWISIHLKAKTVPFITNHVPMMLNIFVKSRSICGISAVPRPRHVRHDRERTAQTQVWTRHWDLRINWPSVCKTDLLAGRPTY
jgi:hypothetical protein